MRIKVPSAIISMGTESENIPCLNLTNAITGFFESSYTTVRFFAQARLLRGAIFLASNCFGLNILRTASLAIKYVIT